MENECITSKMEDYLEAMFNLKEKNDHIRVRDIAKVMKVKMPTVNSMLSSLSVKGLIVHEPYEYVNMTAKGMRIASEIIRRHNLMKKFLMAVLVIDEKTADRDSCIMEHGLSKLTVSRITDFMRYIEGNHKCISGFIEKYKNGSSLLENDVEE